MAQAGLQRQVLSEIDETRGDVLRMSQFVHAHPEIALEEVESAEAVADTLERHGFTVERGVAGLPTAFKATKGSGGPVIAFLAEYDALPELGHGCGHNLIAGSNVAAGIGLAAALEHVPGTVVVFGTPAEEAHGGKVVMVDAGAFDGVDVVLSSHPAAMAARVALEPGSGSCLAVQEVVIVFHGKTAHAASDPENGVNALNAVIHTFTGIDALRQHVTPDVRIHGIITHGGVAPNVVPEYARARFYVRAQTQRAVRDLVEKVHRIAEGAALITGARLEFTEPHGIHAEVVPVYSLNARLQAHYEAMGQQTTPAPKGVGPYSTDLGNVSYVVPTVAVSFPITEGMIPWHSAQVVEAAASELGYASMFKAAKAIALVGLDALTDPAFVQAAKAEHQAAVAARGGSK